MTASQLDSAAKLDLLLAANAEQRADLLRAEGSNGDVNTTLCELAEQTEQLIQRDLNQAGKASEIIMKLADELGTLQTRSRIRRVRSRVLASTGEHDAALTTCHEAIDMAERGQHAIDAARARLASMHMLGELGRFDEAITAGEQARAVFEAAGEPRFAAMADANLGSLQLRCDRPAEALAAFQRAREHLGAEPVMRGQLDSNCGEAMLALNDFSGARDAYNAALGAFQAADLGWAAALAEGNLAELEARYGYLDRSLEHFERARCHLEATESSAHLARLLAEQADVKLILGLVDEARAEYLHALPELESAGMVLELARACRGLGEAQLRCGDHEAAARAFEQAAEHFDALGHAHDRAAVDVMRAQLLVRDDPAVADDLLKKAEAVLRDRPAAHLVALLQKIRLALSHDETPDIADHLTRAMELAKRLGIAPLHAEAACLAGQTALRNADAPAAQAHFRTAIDELERVRGMLQADRFRSAFLGSHLDAYEGYLAALLSGDDASLAEVFAASEHARSRSLVDAIGLDAGNEQDRPAGDASLQNKQAELNALYSQLADAALAGMTGERFKAVTAAVSQLERERDALESRHAARHRLSSRQLTEQVALDRLQRVLEADERLVSYFVLGDEIAAMVVSADDAAIVRCLAEPRQIADAQRKLRFHINRFLRATATNGQSHDDDGLLRELKALADLLLKPLSASLVGAHRLIIAPHKRLHAVPFAALHDGERFAIERWPFTTVPSASVAALLRESQPADASCREQSRALVIGVADENAPCIEQEADEVADILSRHSSVTKLTGCAATVDAVTSAMPQADLIHLACHGYFAPTNPRGSGLRLADGWLTIPQLRRMQLSQPQVVLSGCETGLAGIGAGDENVGLQHALLAAGACSIVVSMWRVHDDWSREFMAHYHNLCHTEKRPVSPGGEPLRAVQLDMIQRRLHPAVWAPFSQVGTSS